MRTHSTNLQARLGRLALILALAVAAAGCTIDSDDGVVFVADLEVLWSIEGSTAPAECDFFGIQRWVVEVRGPEPADVFADCRADFWTTGDALFALAEGFYTVRVRALDPFGQTLALLATDIDLFDRGIVEQIDFTFVPEDFP